MLIIIDRKAPEEAKRNLRKFGRVIEFYTSGIVYDGISGHPDIFFYQHSAGLVVAPDLPQHFRQELNSSNISYTFGEKSLGKVYPQTAIYNALYTSYGILHNSSVSDKKILSSHPQTIYCAQAYTRCNAIQVGKTILTSDKGILKILEIKKIPSVYIDPSGVLLSGFKHGFFGGSCGISDRTLFVCGNLNYHSEKHQITKIAEQENYKIQELCNGPLVDVGGIFFVDS
jgi:hypothetical protein